jgi:hypothetical protein
MLRANTVQPYSSFLSRRYAVHQNELALSRFWARTLEPGLCSSVILVFVHFALVEANNCLDERTLNSNTHIVLPRLLSRIRMHDIASDAMNDDDSLLDRKLRCRASLDPRSPTRLAPAAPRPNLLLSPFSELRTPNDDVQGRGSISILGAT